MNITARMGVVVMTVAALGLGVAQEARSNGVTPFTRKAYEAAGGAASGKGVVLISANWARRWKCGAFQNAQLQSLGFDRAGTGKSGSEPVDLLLEDDSLLPASARFVNFAFIVEPGEYLFSSYRIKAAKSLSEVGAFASDRGTLITDDVSKAGSFRVSAGEVVYVGHFAVDCASAPMPWRFYPQDRAAFQSYLSGVAKEIGGLPVDRATFRLFKTEILGTDFELPE